MCYTRMEHDLGWGVPLANPTRRIAGLAGQTIGMAQRRCSSSLLEVRRWKAFDDDRRIMQPDLEHATRP